MAEEKELIKRRGSFKGRLTYFINYINTLSSYNEPLSESDKRELQLRIGKLEALYEQYDQVQLRLECLVENVDEQFKEREEFESQYYKAIAKGQGLQSNNFDSGDCIGSDKQSRVSNHKLVKLPTIQLPKFSGSYDDYLEFRDTFTSLIHNNDEMDEVNKFHYLRACLEGSAAVVIQSIDFSASNYAIAWQLLCDRFDNKRLLTQNHVSALFNIDVINKESSSNLKRLVDQVNKNLRALESLGEPVKYWDTLLIHIITNKLDQKTYREWEEYKGSMDKNSPISFDTFMQFVRNRADLIETLELSRANQYNSSTKPTHHRLKTMISTQGVVNQNISRESNNRVCPKCKGDHHLSVCSQFLALSVQDRLKLLPSYKLCFNCFRTGHFANMCKKPGCKVCRRRHHSLIHQPIQQQGQNCNPASNYTTPAVSSAPSTTATVRNVALSANISNINKNHCDVLLSTALIKLYDYNNHEHVVRAILDSGSTSSLMTERLFQRLQLTPNKVDKSILGINNAELRVGKTCRVAMKSLSNSLSLEFNCYVLPSITNIVPSREVNISDLEIPSHICLADPTFFKPSDVDVLIGADLFWDLVGTQKIRLGRNKPILCETKLGWIVSGPIDNNFITLFSNDIKCNFTQINTSKDQEIDEIRAQLTRFWQLEEVSCVSTNYTPEEKLCEEHFVQNTVRQSDGRFCVRIPLKSNCSSLGDSFQRAKHCLNSLERRLKGKPNLSRLYYDFMKEYRLLNHMSEYDQHDRSTVGYIIPHHGILRESSTTTKLRVVFNASAPTTSGISLNEIQMVGPTVQDDLLSILLRFRQHRFVIAADVEKMYRQLILSPLDRHLQQILWRDSTSEPIKVYTLNTVTYGMASAPFLATRCLKQLGMDCDNPKVAEIIKHDFFVDDLLSGGDDLQEVQMIRQKVTDVLAAAGMPLRKWISNEPLLVPIDHQSTSLDLNIGLKEPTKLLGLSWHANSDVLCFPIGPAPLNNGNSKRDILSAIARIFDPLGLLGPCVIKMKMLLQQLWLDKISWDTPLSSNIANRWKDIYDTLHLLNNIRIPRIVLCDSYRLVELHVFVDASERAYGACVYVRSVNDAGEVLVRLLIAKSRVAPIKPTTIPRLELCGALTGARLYKKVSTSLRLVINQVYFWSDSTIVLGWLRMLPVRLQPFVRNRVAEILENTDSCIWRHVPTDKNPADLISRGVDISYLENLDLWWNGPGYLKQDTSLWPSQPQHRTDELPETKPDISLSTIVNDTDHHKIINYSRFSNYSRLIRSVAYALRFIKLCRKQPIESNFLKDDELKFALNIIISDCQRESFPEFKLLINNKALPKKSQLLKFNVFVDKNNIIRVGGRIDNSSFSEDKKHPILLQSNHIFTILLFNFEHKRLLHCGPQLLLASIRENYWPIGGRNLARLCYHKCVRCSRMKGKIITPLMGNLPQQRTSPGGYPFESVGVDYAGPIACASRQGRGCRLVKVYIAVFICFTTKAIHLELVGDLTSNNYLCALRRFISRRGKPVNIYSDNGTSFVGAYNDISKFLKLNADYLGENATQECINFHFIPAYSPHFGGLWEAGVKSTKFHLQRVLGNCNLTYEELNTLLTQVEAVLNSRPLTPLSSDPSDFTPLTPGHFLIGRPLTSLPCQDYQSHATSHLSRFQRIEQFRQHFWARWSKEYISELQNRVKWRTCADNLKLDTLVVVKDDQLPPLKWKLGRIVAIHPGADGIVRVADIKTSTGVIRRAFSKICPLPVSSESG